MMELRSFDGTFWKIERFNWLFHGVFTYCKTQSKFSIFQNDPFFYKEKVFGITNAPTNTTSNTTSNTSNSTSTSTLLFVLIILLLVQLVLLIILLLVQLVLVVVVLVVLV